MRKLINKILDNEIFCLVGGTILIFGLFLGGMAVCDMVDRHDSEATVISVQALDEQVVLFETADGNVWEYTFDYDREIKPQDEAILTFKEYENADVTDDRIVDVKWVE